jgi:hypothetical protein
MSLLIEVKDEDKNCEVIINLDAILEIAPKVKFENGKPIDNGCDIFFADAAAVGGRRTMKVKDSYSMFKQFVLETVTAEDVAKVVARANKNTKEKAPVADILEIPKL